MDDAAAVEDATRAGAPVGEAAMDDGTPDDDAVGDAVDAAVDDAVVDEAPDDDDAPVDGPPEEGQAGREEWCTTVLPRKTWMIA
ncbi:hypothetical protein [Streptomyces cinnamoneus]|uniref:hypothetical protein n=1 Tax=Streptomyces cinnamoneus TaxID=53446 RepID=UPI00167CC77A|nr:hypothetical protein [Streptomyces cinnamoneus]